MKVLFMCTANSCRSILSEALFNQMAPEGFIAVSSGSHPGGVVNPLSLKTLQAEQIAIEGLHSKGNADFETSPPDIVITVCDNAAGEACPLYFGDAVKGHWGLEDPSHLQGSDAEIAAAFTETLAHIRRRLTVFFSVPVKSLSRDQLQQAINDIGLVE